MTGGNEKLSNIKCDYFYCCYCNCEESDHYAEICPFRTLDECPVHNDYEAV